MYKMNSMNAMNAMNASTCEANLEHILATQAENRKERELYDAKVIQYNDDYIKYQKDLAEWEDEKAKWSKIPAVEGRFVEANGVAVDCATIDFKASCCGNPGNPTDMRKCTIQGELKGNPDKGRKCNNTAPVCTANGTIDGKVVLRKLVSCSGTKVAGFEPCGDWNPKYAENEMVSNDFPEDQSIWGMKMNKPRPQEPLMPMPKEMPDLILDCGLCNFTLSAYEEITPTTLTRINKCIDRLKAEESGKNTNTNTIEKEKIQPPAPVANSNEINNSYDNSDIVDDDDNNNGNSNGNTNVGNTNVGNNKNTDKDVGIFSSWWFGIIVMIMVFMVVVGSVVYLNFGGFGGEESGVGVGGGGTFAPRRGRA
jgi:hypothetical protein